MRPATMLLLAALTLSLGGCTAVRPWEKGTLAKPAMRFDADPLDAMFAEHVYTSREAAAGGHGVGGGGCGCN